MNETPDKFEQRLYAIGRKHPSVLFLTGIVTGWISWQVVGLAWYWSVLIGVSTPIALFVDSDQPPTWFDKSMTGVGWLLLGGVALGIWAALYFGVSFLFDLTGIGAKLNSFSRLEVIVIIGFVLVLYSLNSRR